MRQPQPGDLTDADVAAITAWLEVRTHAEAKQRIRDAAPDLAEMVQVLRLYAQGMSDQAREAAGDEPATFDEVEEDAAAQAWGEVTGLLSFTLAQVAATEVERR